MVNNVSNQFDGMARWIDSKFFHLHVVGESPIGNQTQGYVNVYNSFHWLRYAWRNWELAKYGIEQIRNFKDREQWPRGAFILFGSIHFYFGMLNCVAQCIHQRYIDKPKIYNIEFSNPKKWSAEIPGEVKSICDKLRDTKGWCEFKDQYRNAITHRQLPIFPDAYFEDMEFLEFFLWAKMNDEGRIVLASNEQLKMAHETDYSSPRMETTYLDDRIKTHMTDSFKFIQELRQTIYDLPYIKIEIVKD